MGDFKNAKEFDRDPLRKSDFYQKVLKPTSGKSLEERWAGRRQSENVSLYEDDPIRKIIKAEETAMKQPDDMPTDQPKAAKKQERVRKKTTSKSQRNNLNSQVTPGEWKTKATL